ncbi:MAG: hypothetical protein HQ510_06625 [Candidatus Marinimicrobia bacterium]|nr:hypothetical protein [Candidatus Neomarinimicrobiota bacterium]
MEYLKAYRIFNSQIKELLNFLNSTNFAFNKIVALRNFVEDKEHRQYLENNEFDTRSSEFDSFKKRRFYLLEETLNQQTLVRAISALEVFLIDIFRDIFIITKNPFKDNSKIHNYTQSQLLSIKSKSDLFNQIINKECRKLSSGGFKEIIKAYKIMLKIDIISIPPGKLKMTEYHDIRHMIVHKLGRTDFQFRKKYNITNKGGISIDSEYLTDCIIDIKAFANLTHELVSNRLRELTTSSIAQSSIDRHLKCHIEILESDLDLDFLNNEFEFWVNDEFEVLKNILSSKTVLSENEFELILDGTCRQIRAYYSKLKFFQQKKIIKIRIIENVDINESINRAERKRKSYIDEDTLELILQQLPEQPWVSGIHKKVAEKLKLKNKVVSTAIQVFINRGVFKQQVYGKIVENGTTTSNGLKS